MKKVLFTAKEDSHVRHFHIPYLKMFKDKGYEVHVASEGYEMFPYCDVKYNIKFGNSPLSKDILNSYKELKTIILENQFDIIHTHTAIASALTRLSAHKLKKKNQINSRIMYTAHGFHFLKGGLISSWLIYYPIERFLAHMTDDLIVINEEDYEIATKHKMGKNRYLVHGVGIDLDKFTGKSKIKKDGNYIITYIAELNTNKNQLLLLNAAIELLKIRKDFLIQLVGSGVSEQIIVDFINEFGLQNNVKLLGYRTDIPEILEKTDLVVATSLREGLPVNVIESLASGVPVIATHCRGHVDLIEDRVNGYIVSYDQFEIAERINELLSNKSLYETISVNNVEKSKLYSIKTISNQMKVIYGL